MIQLSTPTKKRLFSIFFFLFHAVMSYPFLLLYASSLHVSVCLRLAVCCQCVCTCQWAPSERTHQPSAHPVDHTVLPSLLATRLVPAAGCYLSVRARDFSRLEWGDFHVWCVFESPPPPYSFSLPPPALLRRCCWGVTCGRGPAVEKHWFRFLFTLPPTAMALWNREDLKE